MNWSNLRTLIFKNKARILSYMGLIGVPITGWLGVRAGRSVEREIQERKPTSKKEELQMTWKYYIPPTAAGLMTGACIIGGAEYAARDTTAALALYEGGCKLADKAEEAVKEVVGEKKANDIQDQIAVNQMQNDPLDGRPVISTGHGTDLWYDSFSGRYFYADIDFIRQVEYDCLDYIYNCMYMSVSDVFERLNLPRSDAGDILGFNSDHRPKFRLSHGFADNGRPCGILSFEEVPVSEYNFFG